MTMLQDVAIATIIIGERFRKDLGDIAALAASIETVGLLHPIVVTADFRLIAGRRRLAAYVALKRDTIPAYVIDLGGLLQAEFDENEVRKDLNPSERVAICEALFERELEQARARQREAGKKYGRGKKSVSDDSSAAIASGKVPEAIEPHPPVRDVAAKAVGWSGHTYEKARAVVHAAEQDPDDPDLQDLVTKMDRTGNVAAAYRELPLYALPEKEEPPKPKHRKKHTCEELLRRMEVTFIEKVLPYLQDLNDQECEHLKDLLHHYVMLIDTREEMEDA
jgi:ParB-like chromosome segregation protein Spo0J